MLYDREGSCNYFYHYIFVVLAGQISLDEMVDMFLMMVPEEEGEERTTEEVVRKAEDMFNSLDIDGDGEVTEVNVLGKYNKSHIVSLVPG